MYGLNKAGLTQPCEAVGVFLFLLFYQNTTILCSISLGLCFSWLTSVPQCWINMIIVFFLNTFSNYENFYSPYFTDINIFFKIWLKIFEIGMHLRIDDFSSLNWQYFFTMPVHKIMLYLTTDEILVEVKNMGFLEIKKH